nr:MAG TPA: hypothetical protein [Bacteriophage sp.]
MKQDPYYQQLKEIQERGVREVGYFYSVFKDKDFDIQYMFQVIVDKVIPYGIYQKTSPELEDMTLYEYLFDESDGDEEIAEKDVENFKPLAKYFLNYKKFHEN